MSVEALCHTHHVISQGILVNRIQHLEKIFRSTLNMNESDVCITVEDDNNNNNNNNNNNKIMIEIS